MSERFLRIERPGERKLRKSYLRRRAFSITPESFIFTPHKRYVEAIPSS